MSQHPAPWSKPPAPNSSPAPRPGEVRGAGGGAASSTMNGGRVPAPVPATGPSQVPPEQLRTLAYHRLGFADRNHEWWKPLVEGAILFFLFLVLSVLFAIPVILFMDNPMGLDNVATMDQLDPLIFFFLFGSVALLAPAAYLARKIMGPRPLGLLHSVTGRLRWKWMLQCGLAALAIFVVINGLSILLDLMTGGEAIEFTVAPQWGWLLLMVVLLVPIQCFAEELVFRGYLMQTVGRWLKHPAWAILLPVPLFVAGHLYDVWGQASIAVMAITMGVITWRTGGLEAAVALHVVNNCTVTLMAIVGLADLSDTSGGPIDVLFTLAVNGVFLLVVFRMARKTRIATSRTIILPPPPRLPALAQRPRTVSQVGSELAAFVVDPRTQNYLSLPEQYGPYTVRDGQGRPVGLLDVRKTSGPQSPNGQSGNGPWPNGPSQGGDPRDRQLAGAQPPNRGSHGGDSATNQDRTP
ncbi:MULTISPECIES: lysostaphin resistance A-like protein [Kocuria]|uniref:lysostaphin resistance A-like protein n=1 Tax=Kocuria TaxID=57493 RepID=UPI0034CD0475